MGNNDQEVMRALGRIEGKQEEMNGRMDRHGETLVGIDARLRDIEIKAAGTGAVSGGIVSVLVLLIKHLVFPGAGTGTGA